MSLARLWYDFVDGSGTAWASKIWLHLSHFQPLPNHNEGSRKIKIINFFHPFPILCSSRMCNNNAIYVTRGLSRTRKDVTIKDLVIVLQRMVSLHLQHCKLSIRNGLKSLLRWKFAAVCKFCDVCFVTRKTSSWNDKWFLLFRYDSDFISVWYLFR